MNVFLNSDPLKSGVKENVKTYKEDLQKSDEYGISDENYNFDDDSYEVDFDDNFNYDDWLSSKYFPTLIFKNVARKNLVPYKKTHKIFVFLNNLFLNEK